ncbi:hypothetical protein, partial [Aeromonas veronii]|uniref:hypothetical protein n=1 Tax=Aeromonas veronii TaxID=654 RepID=UPI00406C13D8
MDDRLLFDKPNNDRRTVIDETSFNWFGIEYFNIVEDISRPTDWQLQFGTHSLVVHLDGQLKLFESTVENGYGTKKLPLLGEILF